MRAMSLWILSVGMAATLAAAQETNTPRQAPAPQEHAAEQDSPTPASPAAQSQQEAAQPAQPSRPQRPAQSASSRIELEATQITGNRELPRVLHIVPWKRAELDDFGGKPVGSLLDELLTPVDRDVFRRENRYYRALQPDAAEPEK